MNSIKLNLISWLNTPECINLIRFVLSNILRALLYIEKFSLKEIKTKKVEYSEMGWLHLVKCFYSRDDGIDKCANKNKF